jgi:hypothetical protein
MSKTASPEAAAKELERKEGEPFKVGQVSYSPDGTSKSTIYKIDDTTGAVSWRIEQLPGYDKMFEELDDLVDIAKRTASKSKDDPKFRDFYDQIRQIRNQVRTHIRKEHPEIYDRIQMRMAEGINDHLDLVHVYDKDGKMYGTGSVEKVEGDKTFVRFDGSTVKRFPSDRVKPVKESEIEEMSTSAGAGSYLTKYAFKLPKKQKKLPEGTCGYDTDAKSGKKLKTPGGLKENVGATLGPGPKAGPDGVKDNYYVTKFKYKLVPKDKNGNYVQKGSGLEVKNF